MNYPLAQDQWEDARMGEVFDYISNYKGLQIPDDWIEAMDHFKSIYFLCRVVRIDCYRLTCALKPPSITPASLRLNTVCTMKPLKGRVRSCTWPIRALGGPG